MNNFFKYYSLITSFLFISNLIEAQKLNTFADSIYYNSKAWNKSFKIYDTASYYELLDSSFSFVAGAGISINYNKYKLNTVRLHTIRPDIYLNLEIEKAEKGADFNIGYDTGTWIENWTEKGDTKKSELQGRYFRMWKNIKGHWKINSMILTPLYCKGSYCKK